MDLTKYQKIFTEESEKYLKDLDRLLIEVEKDLLNTKLWTEIHGKVHSIKGMARALSLDKISDLSHAMENWCKQFQQGDFEAEPRLVQLIFSGGDLLRLLVANKGEIESTDDQRSYDSLIEKLRKGPEALDAEEDTSGSPPQSRPLIPKKVDYVRVKYSLIEELLGISQEIMLLEKSLPPLSLEHISQGLKGWLDDHTSMLKGLHFRLAQLRLVTVNDFADIFIRTVRNLARENNKEITLEVIGGEIAADIGLLERLREPFVHIFRNCIVHGIEPPDERISMGKSSGGKITLNVTREGDYLFLTVSDDGKGIDRAVIARYLREVKSMSDKEISRLSDEEFFNTILNDDFTSVSTASDMAGRGVGMSVVSQGIDYLGGSMTISSEPSKGTQFSLKLPLSLSIISTVTFKVGMYTFSIPTVLVKSISQTEDTSPEDDNSIYDLRQLFDVRERREFANILNLKSPINETALNGGVGVSKLAVDEIIGNRPLMVMPGGELLSRVGLFTGVGIMESGDLSIVLSVNSLPALSH
jgi:two-component system chemotaxis sensor kinase CheA